MAAAETGLAAGTPVITGGGDAQLGCVGVGVVRPGQAAVFGGSFWQYEALAFKPGLAMRWYRDAFCQLEKAQVEADGGDPYSLMDEEAAKVPAGCYGMMRTFSDVMNYISWKHAAPTFTNFDFDPDRFNRYTFYRAIMENTAQVTRGHIQLVQDATGNLPRELVFAGGAAKSPLWCGILADVLGLPVRVPRVKEATALGAAILAGHGAGVHSSIEQAAESLVQFQPGEIHYVTNPYDAPVKMVSTLAPFQEQDKLEIENYTY